MTTLQDLSVDERATVLGALLDAHPDLRDEADRLALALLADVDREVVADDVVATYLGQSYLDIGSRVGRQPHRGYVHEADAQWELLEEALASFTQQIVRLARLGMADAAYEQAVGVVAGLDRLRAVADQETLIGWGELEDHAWELAQTVAATCRGAEIEFRVDKVVPGWRGLG